MKNTVGELKKAAKAAAQGPGSSEEEAEDSDEPAGVFKKPAAAVAHKKPAAAAAAAAPRKNSSYSVERSRAQVQCRPATGACFAFKFADHGGEAKAIKKAEKWLRSVEG